MFRALSFKQRKLLARVRPLICFYCDRKLKLSKGKYGHEIAIDEATVDHIIPKSKGGSSQFKNKVFACPECNRNKSDALPTHEELIKLKTWTVDKLTI